jgi:hypothetical protein
MGCIRMFRWRSQLVFLRSVRWGMCGVSTDSFVPLSVLFGQAETAATLLNGILQTNPKHVDAILQCAQLTRRSAQFSG